MIRVNDTFLDKQPDYLIDSSPDDNSFWSKWFFKNGYQFKLLSCWESTKTIQQRRNMSITIRKLTNPIYIHQSPT